MLRTKWRQSEYVRTLVAANPGNAASMLPEWIRTHVRPENLTQEVMEVSSNPSRRSVTSGPLKSPAMGVGTIRPKW